MPSQLTLHSDIRIPDIQGSIASENSVEGYFLSFGSSDRSKSDHKLDHKKDIYKYIQLETQSGITTLKLPKHERLNAAQNFKPGDHLRCIGWKKQEQDGSMKWKLDRIEILKKPDFKESNLKPSDRQKSQTGRISLLICQKSDCAKRGAIKLCTELEKALANDPQLAEVVSIKSVGCLKRCKQGANLVVMPSKISYSQIQTAQIPLLLQQIKQTLS